MLGRLWSWDDCGCGRDTPSGILPQSCVGWKTKLSKQEDEAMLSKPKRLLRMNNDAWHICQ